MSDAAPVLAEVWRGPVLECVHRGIAAVARPDGTLVESWGDVARPALPRSALKPLQALSLVERAEADGFALSDREVALAASSHSGAAVHLAAISAWLERIGRGPRDLLCGVAWPADPVELARLRRRGEAPTALHHGCSGKHTGFLTLVRALGASADYAGPDHPVQRAVLEAVEAVADTAVTASAIDGCSVPNFALPVAALAGAMARMARAETALESARGRAAARIRDAMIAHPVLVAGEGRPNTDLIRACAGRAAVKSGAEGVYVAILPEAGLGIALKIDDGAARAAVAAIAALLARHGALDRDHPVWAAAADAPVLNARGINCGRMRAADVLL